MIYQDVFQELGKAKIKYLVVGGIAINLYGVLRATADLDMMIYLADNANVNKFVEVVKNLGYKPRAPVSIEDFGNPAKRKMWIKDKGALVFTFLRQNSYEQIDVFLEEPIDFMEAYKTRKDFRIGDVTISVPSLENLKFMKWKAHREKDLSDIKQLEKLEKMGHESA